MEGTAAQPQRGAGVGDDERESRDDCRPGARHVGHGSEAHRDWRRAVCPHGGSHEHAEDEDHGGNCQHRGDRRHGADTDGCREHPASVGGGDSDRNGDSVRGEHGEHDPGAVGEAAQQVEADPPDATVFCRSGRPPVFELKARARRRTSANGRLRNVNASVGVRSPAAIAMSAGERTTTRPSAPKPSGCQIDGACSVLPVSRKSAPAPAIASHTASAVKTKLIKILITDSPKGDAHDHGGGQNHTEKAGIAWAIPAERASGTRRSMAAGEEGGDHGGNQGRLSGVRGDTHKVEKEGDLVKIAMTPTTSIAVTMSAAIGSANPTKRNTAMPPTSRTSRAVGYAIPGAAFDTCIVIRTLVLHKGVAYLQAGAGIVADSDPQEERRELPEQARRARDGDSPGRGALVILLVDNYDSFTYNLAHLFGELGCEVVVLRNDQLDADEAERLAPSHLVVSPWAGAQAEAGATVDVIRRLAPHTRTLGVCLGHQAIVEAFGGEVGFARELVHGKAASVTHDGRGIFAGLPESFEAGRYHSLAATTVPRKLEVSATSADGEVMGVRRRELPVDGVQFHPESVLTPLGSKLAKNFLESGS